MGLVNGIGSMFKTGKFSSLYNNPTNQWLDDINKKMEDWMPNYYTQAEKNAEWYSPKNILTANFWSDKILKNLAQSLQTLFIIFLYTLPKSRAIKLFNSSGVNLFIDLLLNILARRSVIIQLIFGLSELTEIKNAAFPFPRYLLLSEYCII